MLLLVVAMAMPMNAESYWAGDLCYVVVGENTVAVTSGYYWTSHYSGELVIPENVTISTYESTGCGYNERTYRVVGIYDDAFSQCDDLTSVVLPNSITYIGENAFYHCDNLVSINIPNSVKSIGDYAFEYCTSLQSIYMPSSVTHLGYNVFYNCSALTSVRLSNSISELDGTFQYCSALEHIEIPSSVRSLNYTFCGCTALKEIFIPNSVTYLGAFTFSDCTSLTSVSIPSTVSRLYSEAFSNCSSLATITVRNIEPPTMSYQNIFNNNTYATALLRVPQLALPTYRERNWWNLFQNIEGDESLNNEYDFEEGGIYYLITGENTVSVTYRDKNYNSYSNNVTIPVTVTHGSKTYSVTTIGACAFKDCTGITVVTIPTSVQEIGSDAFAGCTSVNTLNWNAVNCWSIGELPTSGITTVNIGNTVESLPNNFVKESAITDINIPASVTAIGDSAFFGCTGITSLTIPESVSSIHDNAFEGCSSINTLNWNAVDCWSNGNMPTAGIVNPHIGDRVEVLPIGFLAGSPISSIDIPDGVKHIGGNAFYQCGELTEIDLPDSLRTIGNNTFNGCSKLTSITIPVEVSSIGYNSFANCPGITTLNWNARNCLSTGWELTGDISRFTTITTATIGNEVETLPEWFLYDSKITSIRVGDAVTTLPGGFCNSCPNLQNVYISKSVAIIEFDFWGNWYSPFGNCPMLESIVIDEANPVYDSRENCNAIIVTASNTLRFACKNSFVPNTVTRIGSYTFNGFTNLTEVDLSSVIIVEDGAFGGCSGLTNLNLSKADTIGYQAFYYCSGLTSIDLSSARYIDYGAFEQCSSLTSVDLPRVEKMYTGAFYNCSALTSVTLGRYTKGLYWGAFSHCTSISDFTCLATTPPFVSDESVFYGFTDTATLHVPWIAVEAYQQAQYWKNFVHIEAIIPEAGDVDGDGELGISDVSSLIDNILAGKWLDNPGADVDGNGVVDIGDVSALIDLLLNGGL